MYGKGKSNSSVPSDSQAREKDFTVGFASPFPHPTPPSSVYCMLIGLVVNEEKQEGKRVHDQQMNCALDSPDNFMIKAFYGLWSLQEPEHPNVLFASSATPNSSLMTKDFQKHQFGWSGVSLRILALRLALYVYEYLLHVGAQKSAQTFLSEIRWEKNITLGEPPGFLHSWWCVFWDLYCAAPERRETCEHSSEAKAFHDYVSFVCLYYIFINVMYKCDREVFLHYRGSEMQVSIIPT
ncbi:hypothetical protein Q9233_011637 [Columba guinea]|nr:hypothetical protein Q9233_011637 [Columba guinea]